MKFVSFEIITSKEAQSLHQEEVQMAVNLDHVVSVKPIKFIVNEKIIYGYWVRLTNGKKYKATKIPKEVADAFLSSPINHLPQVSEESSLEDIVQ